MSIEARLYTHLTTWPGLSTVTGSRTYPEQLPQDEPLPALTYTRISTDPVLHRGDGGASTPAYSRARFQIVGWADNFDGTIVLRALIYDAMGNFALLSSPRVDVALLAGDRGGLEAEPGRWRCTLDYMIYFQED